MRSSLILGTVQFGLDYGIANSQGKPDQEQVNAIVRFALANDVTTFDTAQDYGDSEQVLGLALKKASASEHVRVITKLAPSVAQSGETVAQSLERSRQRLAVPGFFCVMLHKEEQLHLLFGTLGQRLAALKKDGLLKNIGISVYTPKCALAALANPLIDIVQLPASLFDRRFEQAGVFMAAQMLGKEIHIRSIFLQGALLMQPEALPSFLKPIEQNLARFRELCRANALAPSQAALLWIQQRYPCAKIIFGAESPRQLRENLDAAIWQKGIPPMLIEQLNTCLPPQDEEILNPSLWKRQQ